VLDAFRRSERTSWAAGNLDILARLCLQFHALRQVPVSRVTGSQSRSSAPVESDFCAITYLGERFRKLAIGT
jgi:hypothetical protein